MRSKKGKGEEMQNTFKSLKIKFRTLNWQLPPNRGVYNIENKFKNLCVCCWQSKLTATQRAWACIYGPQTKISEGAHVSSDAHNDSAKDAVSHGSSSLRTATQFLISNDETDSFKKNTVLHCASFGLEDLAKRKSHIHLLCSFLICFYG